MHRRSRDRRPRRGAAAPLRGAGILAIVLAVALGTVASASAGSLAAEATPPAVIRLVSTTTDVRLVLDKAPKGVSKGDTIFSASVLSNAVAQFGLAKGAVVGKDAGSAKNLGGTPTTVDVVVTLPGGTLRVKGRSRMVGKAEVLPVVGGTGQYQGVTGTLTVTEGAGPALASNVYRLRYPSRAIAARG